MNIYTNYCATLQKKQRFRKLPATQNPVNQNIIDLSSNDYLGLSADEQLLHSAYAAGKAFGVGSTGSRLLSGNNQLFEDLEKQIAHDKKTAAALIFNSGYQANISVLPALCNSQVLSKPAILFFDKLNHASLYQGAFLSNAQLVRYRHNDLADLKKSLLKYKDSEQQKFIVTETLFGMDGDIANLQELIALANEFNTWLYLDEAHATGVLGKQGYGLSTTVNLQSIPHIIMGTFSKAIGVCGAYIACSQEIKEYLINACIGFIYSTSLSPMILGAVNTAWQMLPTFEQERNQLLHKAKYMRDKLKTMGFDTGLSSTHIIPIILQDEVRALEVKEKLLTQGFLVSAIRPPTVPPNTSRLRIALNVKCSDPDIEHFLTAMRELI